MVVEPSVFKLFFVTVKSPHFLSYHLLSIDFDYPFSNSDIEYFIATGSILINRSHNRGRVLHFITMKNVV